MATIIGSDIGGTFTDLVVLDDQGNITISKAPSTPPEFAQGLMDAIGEAARQLKTTPRDLLKGTKLFSHGSTVATNALINQAGAKVGLITTRGFEEALWLMRGAGYAQGLPVESWYHKGLNERPFDLVPLDRTVGVSERVDKAGEVLVALDEEEVLRAGKTLVEEKGCEALTVCFLWSFANPAHERRAVEVLRRAYPSVFVNTSHEVLPLIGEYERFSTTVLASYLRPEVEKYVRDLDGKVRASELKAPFLMMQANGGLLPALASAECSVSLLQSGPAGGVIAGKIIAGLIGSDRVITSDMGGTSYDISLVVDGAIRFTTRSYHERHAVAAPMVDVESIGAGGGSLTRVIGGELKVGPQSAGARPGPVCYGRGGKLPTVTDANLVLGYLNPDYFLGGRMRLDRAGAERALHDHVAKPLGLTLEEAADGIHRIVDSHMSDATRFHVLQRGYDPREFDLLVFGGATAAHTVGIGEDLEVRSMIIPLAGLATVLSAFGIANADVERFYSASRSCPFPPGDGVDLEAVYKTMEEQAAAELERDGFGRAEVAFHRIGKMRYHMQLTDIDVELPAGTLDPPACEEIVRRFDRRYAELYGETAGFREGGRDLISQFLRAVAFTRKGKLEAQGEDGTDPKHALKGSRKAWFSKKGEGLKAHETGIYDGDRLRPGNVVAGPAVLEMAGTTAVVPPGYQARYDVYRNVYVEREGAKRPTAAPKPPRGISARSGKGARRGRKKT